MAVRRSLSASRTVVFGFTYRTNGCKRGLPWWTVDQTSLTKSHNTQFLAWHPGIRQRGAAVSEFGKGTLPSKSNQLGLRRNTCQAIRSIQSSVVQKNQITFTGQQDVVSKKGVSHEKELSHGGSLGIGPSIINSFLGQSASPSMISFPGSSTSVVPYCDLGVVLHKSLQRLREFVKALWKVRHVRWNMETPDIWGTLDERPVCFLVETHWVHT
ncbi:hypothetical protein Bbelb_235240 [Branchiostoma belcheri]|nr:hypothetical protein Bbelb_235240 [Branchiostoma belcheri]